MGRTPLHIAALRGRLEMIQILVESSADINCEDEDQATPLHYASEHGYPNLSSVLYEVGFCDICEYLILRGADLNKKNRFGQKAHELASDDDVVELFSKSGLVKPTDSYYGRAQIGNKMLKTSRSDHVQKLLEKAKTSPVAYPQHDFGG
jgi:hypothetical protein